MVGTISLLSTSSSIAIVPRVLLLSSEEDIAQANVAHA